jgi:GTP-binding protein
MSVPVVAIVGRPNVGKSSLFNWLAGRRIAIVDPTPGVTRDRVSTLVRAEDSRGRERYFELVDTGGMGIDDVDDLTNEVEQQIQHAIDQAHVVLFVTDARSGVVPLDELVAERLRGLGKVVLSVVNKCDTPELESHASDFHRLGYDPLIAVSAQQNRGKNELFKALLKRLPNVDDSEATREVVMKLAIVGRRNTGKSTFINALAESERVIVSEVAGTTRDSVDVRFERDGKVFIAIDTAGVRRKRSVKGDIEFYSMARAERSIRRADVVLLFFDPRWTVSRTDKQLAEYVLDYHKPAIFVVNKWDLAKDRIVTGEFGDYLRKIFPSLDAVPIAFVTAKDGKNVYKVLNLAQNLYKQASARVTTSELNRVLRKALELSQPPMRQNRRPKIYFATQVASNPPTIVLITNGPELIDNTYQRYLLKTFRDELPFHDIPMKLYLRRRNRDEADGADDDADEVAMETPKRPAKPPRPLKKPEVAVKTPKRPAKPPRPQKKPAPRRRSKSELWND